MKWNSHFLLENCTIKKKTGTAQKRKKIKRIISVTQYHIVIHSSVTYYCTTHYYLILFFVLYIFFNS